MGLAFLNIHILPVEPPFIASDWCGLSWTDFVPLPMRQGAGRSIPTGAGVYRVRVVGRDVLSYIGQTGRNLNERLRGLGSGLLAAEMPFNDPHTATPKLWSYRDGDGFEFEASAAETDLTKNDRMALECWLVWRYRQVQGRSTLCNFGRLHPRYVTSRNRSTNLRGRKLNPDEPDNTGGESVHPLIRHGNPVSADWMGLSWSAFTSLDRTSVRTASRGPGLYRLSTEAGVVYLGQSLNVADRLRTHTDTAWGTPLVYSFCTMPTDSTPTQLLEVENDLIAGYFDEYQAAPAHQFGGQAEDPAE